MPVKPPPIYRANNALPILPKMGPAVYTPQTVQRKPDQPAAPPVYRPAVSAASPVSPAVFGVMPPMTIQRSSKGVDGGKGGLGYGDAGGGDEDENRRALERADLAKGIKGHKKGKKGSGVSGQTKKETARFVEVRKEIREETKSQKQQCRQFHKRRNLGETCPGCRKEVASSML